MRSIPPCTDDRTRSALVTAVTCLAILGLAPAGAVSGAVAQDALDPTGLWLTEEETAVVEIERCEGELCGSIHWLAEGGRRYDTENPDESLRDRPLCGLPLLYGFTRNPDRPNEWRDGQVYAADDGNTYSGRIRVEGSDELELRGYRGIALFGRSQTWTRVSAEDYPRCTPPSGGAGNLGSRRSPGLWAVRGALWTGELSSAGGVRTRGTAFGTLQTVPQALVGQPSHDVLEPLRAVAQLDEAENLFVQVGIAGPQVTEKLMSIRVGVERERVIEGVVGFTRPFHHMGLFQ